MKNFCKLAPGAVLGLGVMLGLGCASSGRVNVVEQNLNSIQDQITELGNQTTSWVLERNKELDSAQSTANTASSNATASGERVGSLNGEVASYAAASQRQLTDRIQDIEPDVEALSRLNTRVVTAALAQSGNVNQLAAEIQKFRDSITESVEIQRKTAASNLTNSEALRGRILDAEGSVSARLSESSRDLGVRLTQFRDLFRNTRSEHANRIGDLKEAMVAIGKAYTELYYDQRAFFDQASTQHGSQRSTVDSHIGN